MKNNEYWAERFKIIEDDAYKKSANLVGEIDNIYRDAISKIEKDIDVWYQRFADNNNISFNEAKKQISSKELRELQWNVKAYVKKGEDNAITGLHSLELENASSKVHIDRLEALKYQLQVHSEELFGNMTDKLDSHLKNIYSEGYYRSIYEVQKGIGTYFDIAKIDNNFLNKIINKPWAEDGSNFSERIWGKYRPTLVNRLHKDLTDCIIRGDNPNKLIDALASDFKVSQNAAGRLIMSEYAYFNSLAAQDSLNELSVEEFEVIETLDNSTCSICQEMDGKHFPMSQYEVGVTAPPFHNFCRGTTVPYFNDEFTVKEMRAARDENGDTYCTNVKNYKEWKAKCIKEGKTDYIDNNTRKMYENYKSVLGENNIGTLAEFAEMVYNKGEVWEDFKAYKNSIVSGELTSLANYNLYRKTSKDIDNKLVGVTTSNKIYITEKSKHFVSRVIGSIEQRRNGVSVDDILEALTNPKADVLPIRTSINGNSQKIRFNGIEVTINPDTGVLIQTNPLKRGKK